MNAGNHTTVKKSSFNRKCGDDDAAHYCIVVKPEAFIHGFVTASYSQDGQTLSTVWPEYKAIVSAYQAKIQLKVVGGRVLSKK